MMPVMNIRPVDGTPEQIDEIAHDYYYERNRREAAFIRSLDIDWPQSPRVRRALLDYVGLEICLHSEPLYFHSVSVALLKYGKEKGVKPDHDRFEAFMVGSLDLLAEKLVGLRLKAKSDEWKASSRVPFKEWKRKHPSYEVAMVKPEPGELFQIKAALVEAVNDVLGRTMPKPKTAYLQREVV